MRTMRAYQGIVSAIALIACIGCATAQVSLRNRVDSSRTFQAIAANSVLEFLSSGGFTYVAFGGSGLAIYRYQQGQPPQRIGYHYSPWLSNITDLAFGPFGSLACVSGTGVYLLSFRVSDLSLVPHGRAVSQNAGLNAARVRSLRDLDIANTAYLIVGTNTGRLRVYSLLAEPELPPAPSLDTPLNVGNPIVDVALFSDAVRALAAWEFPTGQQYIAVGGSNGMVYLYRFASGSITPIGKAMYHPAPVEEIVVNGNRLIVGLRNGQVYVWNYTSSSVSHHLTIKEPWSPLTAYSLCALPNDRVAVATGSMRVYSLANGAQVGEYGAHVYGAIHVPRSDYYYGWFALSVPYNFISFTYPTLGSYPMPLVRVAPFIGNDNNYFYVAGVQGHVRTSFLPPPASLTYQTIALPLPAYAVTYMAANPPYAVGLANGEVRAFGSSRNVGAPVFSLMPAQPWLLGSYGVGNVFAWSSETFVSNILPAASSPRIVYSLRLISVSGSNDNLFTFATASSDGKVEVWRWDSSTPNTPATLLSEQSLPYPLHSLSVNAARSSVAVASLNAPFYHDSTTHRSAWTLSLSSNDTLGTPTALDQPVRVVAYHPSDPNLLATVWQHHDYWVWRGGIYLLRPSQQPHFLGGSAGFLTSLSWLSTDLLAASDSVGMVYVLSPNGALNNPLNRDGTTRNIYYGNPGDALRAAYQPHRGYVYEISGTSSGLVTAGADRTVRLFSNSGLPIHFFQAYLGDGFLPLGSIDYLPNGGVALNHTIVYPSSNQAYSLFASPPGHAAFWVPNTASAVYVNPVVQEIQNNQVRVGEAFSDFTWTHIANFMDYRVELSENGQYVLVARLEDRHYGASGRARAWILSRSTSFPYFSGNRYTLYQYTSASDPYRLAFSPSGDWVALTVNATTINVYQRSAITSDNPPHHSVITYSTAPQGFIALKFLADDVLAVWQRTNSINYLDIWQLSGTTWTLRQSVNTGIDYPDFHYFYHYALDAVPVGSVVRVALGGANTLVFYRLDRPSGVPTLTEVGRATLASNGYLDIPLISWVRFSRQNPNILGVAQARYVAITYDLSGLFSW